MAAINPEGICIGETRGKGFMVGEELVEDPETKTPAAAGADKVRAAMRKNGLLIGMGGRLESTNPTHRIWGERS